jgi:hypothetical protein
MLPHTVAREIPPARGILRGVGIRGAATPEGDSAMQENGDHDPGTSVEPLSEFVKLLTAQGPAFADSDGHPPAGQPMPGPSGGRPMRVVEQPYRPVNRPPIPLLSILDDGSATTGETVRLREPVCLIGRTEGHVVIPHDHSMSSRHAEIVRDGVKPPYTWYLRDVGSTNGTFVCCDSAPLRADRLVMLGSRRFRMQVPGGVPASPSNGNAFRSTSAADAAGAPMLVETTAPADPICIRLVGSRVAVGRPGFDNHVGIDDPLLASLHAVITQAADGTWWIDAMPSRNGVWIQVRSVELTDSCRFQCGEQRFMFVRP